MLDEFLKVAHAREQEKVARRELIDLVGRLPVEDIQKLASGEPLEKWASHDDEWLDRYKGTPLFAQALELERQGLELDAQELEARERRRAREAQEDEGPDNCHARDRLRLQRKLLDLELAKSEGGGVAPGPEPLPPAPVEAKEAGIRQGLKRTGELLSGSRVDSLKQQAKSSPFHGKYPGFMAREVADESKKVRRARQVAAVAGSAGAGAAVGALAGRKKEAAPTMDVARARRVLAPHFTEAVYHLAADGAVDAPSVAQLAIQLAKQDMKQDREAAQWVEQHPGTVRAARGVAGGLLGALGGAAIGNVVKHPGMGALAGAAFGGAAASVPRPTGDGFRQGVAQTRDALRALDQKDQEEFARRVIARGVLMQGPLDKEAGLREAGQAVRHGARRAGELVSGARAQRLSGTLGRMPEPPKKPRLSAFEGESPLDHAVHAGKLKDFDAKHPGVRGVRKALEQELGSEQSKVLGTRVALGVGALHGANALKKRNEKKKEAAEKEAFLGAAAGLASRALPGVGRAIASGGQRAGLAAGRALNQIPGQAALGRGSALARGVGGASQAVGKAVQHGGLAAGAKALGGQAAGFARKNPLAAAGIAGGMGLVAGNMMG